LKKSASSDRALREGELADKGVKRAVEPRALIAMG
jgi:hypothetical protein